MQPYIYVYQCICILHTHTYIYIYIYIHTFASIYTCVYVNICIYMVLYACMCILFHIILLVHNGFQHHNLKWTTLPANQICWQPTMKKKPQISSYFCVLLEKVFLELYHAKWQTKYTCACLSALSYKQVTSWPHLTFAHIWGPNLHQVRSYICVVLPACLQHMTNLR